MFTGDLTTWRNPTEIISRSVECEVVVLKSNMDSPCVVCGKQVESLEKAFQCDACDQWEHVDCIRRNERPDEELYEALVRRPSKAILFMCTRCRQKGSIMKRIMQLKNELTHAQSVQLASARL